MKLLKKIYYQEFQENLKNKLDNKSILDEENRIWIDVAKERNNFNI